MASIWMLLLCTGSLAHLASPEALLRSHLSAKSILTKLERNNDLERNALPLAASQKATTGAKKLALSQYPVDCYSKPQSDLPFCDPKLPFMERAKDLESRLTLEEKIQQTSTIAPAIERFGIKDYNWRSNCLHGWSASGGHWLEGLTWTVFPAPIGLGATFDPALISKIGQATADEGRALHNVMMDANDGSSTEAAGLNCFSPNVNLFRDPRWGRGQETFGEDPYLIASIGAAYTRGLQIGEDTKYLKIAACAKHFTAHSGPEERRLEFSANVTLHDLYDTYLPAFKTQVMGAKVAQVMPAYSGLRCDYQPDGAPDAANPFLLKTVLREEFNAPDISVVSDNGAVSFVYTQQKYVSSPEQAAAVCMNATTDLDLGYDSIYPNFLQKALERNDVQLETIRDAVVRNFYLRMRLGDFDYSNSYNDIGRDHLGTMQNQELNLEAARKSIVLLKNAGYYGLPLDPRKIRNLAVIGPNANATDTLLSNYEGIPFKTISVLEGIKEVFVGSNITVNYAPGCADVKCETTDGFSDAVQIAKSADYVIMVMGLDQTVEAEGRDRVHVPCNGAAYDVLEPPGCQNALVQLISELNSNIVIILINGGPLSLSQIYPNRAVVGIIEAFYPGALGGTAVADVLFGQYSPGGRMPVTTYVSSGEVPPAVDYGMSTPPGRTYRYYQHTPLIPFGYGLSYADFFYRNMTVSQLRIAPCESVNVTVGVDNFAFSSVMDTDEVILLYLVPPKQSNKPFFPNVQLVGFERVTMTPSQKYVARFEINPYLQSLVDEDGEHYLFPGLYMLYSTHQPGDRDSTTVKGNFTITGDSPVKTSTCTSSPQCLAC